MSEPTAKRTKWAVVKFDVLMQAVRDSSVEACHRHREEQLAALGHVGSADDNEEEEDKNDDDGVDDWANVDLTVYLTLPVKVVDDLLALGDNITVTEPVADARYAGVWLALAYARPDDDEGMQERALEALGDTDENTELIRRVGETATYEDGVRFDRCIDITYEW
jgi:hypothetical protein